MGRLYFAAPNSNNKNNKGQHRTTIILFKFRMLTIILHINGLKGQRALSPWATPWVSDEADNRPKGA